MRASLHRAAAIDDLGRRHAEARAERGGERSEVPVADEDRDLADRVAARLEEEHRLVEAACADVRQRTWTKLALERAKERALGRGARARESLHDVGLEEVLLDRG